MLCRQRGAKHISELHRGIFEFGETGSDWVPWWAVVFVAIFTLAALLVCLPPAMFISILK